MPAYHSIFNQEKFQTYWGIPYIAFNENKSPTLDSTKLTVPLKESNIDIIDEAIMYFRANVLYKNFAIEGDADKLLVYITVFVQKCLEKANVPDANNAKTNMKKLVDDCEFIPQVENFFNTLVTKNSSQSELLNLQKYLKTVRKEVVSRLINLLFESKETSIDLKYWLGLGKKKFMGYDMPVRRK